MYRSRFKRFPLPSLLPEGHVLIVDMRAHFFDYYVVSQLSGEIHGLLAQEIFTEQELYALVALLEAYPDYCSQETLLLSLSDKTFDQAPQLVHEAMKGKARETTLNMLRNLLARCRPRLHDFGIDIGSRVGLGYQLHRVEGVM